MTTVDGIPERILGHEDLVVGPVVVKRAPEERIWIPGLMSTRSVVRSSPPITIPGVTNMSRPQAAYMLVAVVARLRVLEGTPAAEQDAATANLVVSG